MSIATRHPRGLNWKSPWVTAVAGLAVGIAATVGVGFGLGLYKPSAQGGPPVAASPSPSPSAVESPSPTASPQPSSSPSPSVVAQLRGKIAISDGSPAPGSGGWITFPGAAFAADAGSNVKLPPLGDFYNEAYGLTQVKSTNRWLPVPRNAVSPDGSRYAYYDGSVFHVVGGGSPELLLGQPVSSIPMAKWSVLATEDSGLYITCTRMICATDGSRVWWLPYSGPMVTVASSGSWTTTDGKYAYGTTSTSMNEHTVMRLDLSTGARTNIFTVPDMHLTAVGIAADGRPVILAIRWDAPLSLNPTLAQIWLAGTGAPVKIHETAAADITVFSVVGDTMGTWVATSKGLYLYSASAGFEFVSPVAGPLASAFRA